MSTLEQAVEDCLALLSSGQATIEECIARNPQYAVELRRILSVTQYLARGKKYLPSAAAKSRTRLHLAGYLQTHPRSNRRAGSRSFSTTQRWRVAFGLASALIVLLTSGIVLAQSALPGQLLYGWKLASEQIWRSINSNPFEVDLALTQRRADELVAVSGNTEWEAYARDRYQLQLQVLVAYHDPRNLPALKSLLQQQKSQLKQVGISVPALEQLLPSSATPAPFDQSPREPHPLPLPSESIPTGQPSNTSTPSTIAVPTIVPSIELPTAVPTLNPSLNITGSIGLPIPF